MTPYPDFESDPHPALWRAVKLNLRTLELDCWDYADSDNPPILHRKETMLTDDHPLYAKFARLTQQEERHGLLDEEVKVDLPGGRLVVQWKGPGEPIWLTGPAETAFEGTVQP